MNKEDRTISISPSNRDEPILIKYGCKSIAKPGLIKLFEDKDESGLMPAWTLIKGMVDLNKSGEFVQVCCYDIRWLVQDPLSSKIAQSSPGDQVIYKGEPGGLIGAREAMQMLSLEDIREETSNGLQIVGHVCGETIIFKAKGRQANRSRPFAWALN